MAAGRKGFGRQPSQGPKEELGVNRTTEPLPRQARSAGWAWLGAARKSAARGGMLLALAVAFGTLWPAAPPALAQQGAAPAAAAPKPQSSPAAGRSFSIRYDEDLYQLEEVAPLIAASLNRVSDRVSALAINSFSFGKEVDQDFRSKAEMIMEGNLLNASPNVRLVQCQECQRLEARIVNGVLRLKKGIPSREAWVELAKKLGVDGFIDIGVFRDHHQLTVYIKVVEAQTGTVLLVDEIVGRPAPKRDAVTLSFGEINFPVVFGRKTHTENALSLTVTEQVQLTSRFSFGVDAIVYTDNNQYSTDPHVTLDGGVMLSPFVGYDVVQLPQSKTRLQLYLGAGKLLDNQLNYGDVLRAGFIFIVGDRLVVTFGENYFSNTNIALSSGEKSKQPLLAKGAQLNGEAYELRFGYRF